jgi:hypothetical protein
MKQQIVLFVMLLSFSIAGSALATDAENTKDLDDEIRATLVKSQAIMKRFDGGKQTQYTTQSGDQVMMQRRQGPRHGTNGRNPNAQASNCEMNIDSQEQQQGRQSRRSTTVVTGNVIQMCN